MHKKLHNKTSITAMRNFDVHGTWSIDGNRYNGKADFYSISYPLLEKGKMTVFTFHKKVIDDNYRPTFNVPIKKLVNLHLKRYSKS